MTNKRVSIESASKALDSLKSAQPKKKPKISVVEFVKEHRNLLLEQVKRLGSGDDVWGRQQVCEALKTQGIEINQERLRDLLRSRRRRSTPPGEAANQNPADPVIQSESAPKQESPPGSSPTLFRRVSGQ